jgi:hypothetical protein
MNHIQLFLLIHFFIFDGWNMFLGKIKKYFYLLNKVGMKKKFIMEGSLFELLISYSTCIRGMQVFIIILCEYSKILLLKNNLA